MLTQFQDFEGILVVSVSFYLGRKSKEVHNCFGGVVSCSFCFEKLWGWEFLEKLIFHPGELSENSWNFVIVSH